MAVNSGKGLESLNLSDNFYIPCIQIYVLLFISKKNFKKIYTFFFILFN